MSATLAAPITGEPTALTPKTMIVDCDIHHSVGGPENLYPYLPRHFVEYIEDFGPMMPRLGYTNMPGNGARPVGRFKSQPDLDTRCVCRKAPRRLRH